MRIVGNPPSGGKQPTTPTIGTATDGGTGTTVSVAFTPSTYIGKGTITYTATSSPGSLTGTGSGSPITVSGLTTGTTYSFTVAGTTNYGVSSLSSAQSNFVTPAAPSSFESITTISPSGTGTVTFSSIPSTYKSLQIRYIVRASTGLATNQDLRVRFNGDSGTNYARHNLTGNGASATSGAAITQAQWQINDGATDTTTLSDTFVGGVIDLIDYASTSKTKTVRNFWGYDANGSGIVSLYNGLWNSTSAINSISFTLSTGNYASGTSFALYGIKGS